MNRILLAQARSAASRIDLTSTTQIDLDRYLHPKQLRFVEDKSDRVVACCSRRAGKTIGAIWLLVTRAQRWKESQHIYLAPTRAQAKRIFWRPLKRLARDHGWAIEFSDTELVATFANGSVIYLSGAKDESELDKLLGNTYRTIVVDEGQAYRAHIQRMIERELAPSTWDCGGQVFLLGTPGFARIGYFFEVTAGGKGQWSRHHWTIHDNTYLQDARGMTADEILRREAELRGVTMDDPTIQREGYGRWVTDPSAQVFKWRDEINAAENRDGLTSFVMGIDIGHDDADAIGVLGWSRYSDGIDVVDEWQATGQTTDQLFAKIEEMRRRWGPIAIVADTGGLGKKIVSSFVARYGTHIIAAGKSEKWGHIELVNNDLRTGRLKARPDSIFREECLLTQWDIDKKQKGVLAYDDRYHPNLAEAILYAHRWAYHYAPQDEPRQMSEDDRLFEARMRKLTQKRKGPL